MKSNFLLGQLTITPEAQRALKRVPYDLIARHAVNDHGQISPSERKANAIGMKTAGRIISRFRVDPTDPASPYAVVVTDDNWKETSVVLEPVRRRALIIT